MALYMDSLVPQVSSSGGGGALDCVISGLLCNSTVFVYSYVRQRHPLKYGIIFRSLQRNRRYNGEEDQRLFKPALNISHLSIIMSTTVNERKWCNRSFD